MQTIGRPPARTASGSLRGLLAACRPLQWQKNLLLYAAFVFSAGTAWSWREPSAWLPLFATATVAFLLFNVIASGEYLINDALDADRDRLHPRKRLRPVASGAISTRLALTAGGILLASGVLGALLFVSAGFALVAGAYAALALAYSAWLKRVVIVDVVVIALGFMLRALAGAVAIAVVISPWLLVCTALGALFVAVAKRRQELVLLAAGAEDHRAVLGDYTADGLSAISWAAAAATIVAYGLYLVTAPNLPDNHLMLLTLPLVVYGVFRYRLIAERTPERNADELVLRDIPLLASVLLFAVTSLLVMALSR
jgi:4-hydroxybenzoate polyprenyltransferase